MCFKRSFEVTKGAESRVEAGILFQVAGAETANECLWKSRKGVRPVQSGSSARAQCPQWLMPMQLTCKVSRCASMDGSECYGPKLELTRWRIGSQCS